MTKRKNKKGNAIGNSPYPFGYRNNKLWKREQKCRRRKKG